MFVVTITHTSFAPASSSRLCSRQSPVRVVAHATTRPPRRSRRAVHARRCRSGTAPDATRSAAEQAASVAGTRTLIRTPFSPGAASAASQ